MVLLLLISISLIYSPFVYSLEVFLVYVINLFTVIIYLFNRLFSNIELYFVPFFILPRKLLNFFMFVTYCKSSI